MFYGCFNLIYPRMDNPGNGRPQDYGNTRNLLIVEFGKDWAARRDDKIEHWLASHVGAPLSAPNRPKRR